MRNKLLIKINKKILSILLLLIIIIMASGLTNFMMPKSYATTYTYTSKANTLPENFEETYPGYKELIEELAKAHPNWTFNLYETGLVWETVIINESTHGVNLVPKGSSTYSGDWVCQVCGVKTYDTGKWYCASEYAIAYMMDPRNSINETDIFQFQDLSSAEASEDAITKMVEGTFIDNEECIEAIFTAATTYNVSPYHLVSRIIQEQGTKGSTLGLGIEKDGVTYYNLFNIGASGDTESEVIQNGLDTAISKKWTTMGKAIIGGAEFVAKNYIAIGQSTLYYQKFNVVYKDSLYRHQYMQNLLAAQNEGGIMRSEYINYDILESNFTFTIPLYKNMPAEACSRPSSTTVTLEEGELAYINASGGLALRDAPNGDTITYVAEGTQISITKRATSKVGGFYWDKVSTPKGSGYMAREASDGTKTYLVLIKDETTDKSNNTFSEPNENNIIFTKIETTAEEILKEYPEAKIKNSKGTEITGKTLISTGDKIFLEEKEAYTLVKLGDVTGDGKVTSADYVRIKNYLRSKATLTNAEKSAADPTNDGKITSADYVRIKNYLRGKATISI